MAYGLRVWDASGNLTLDTTDSITRVLGSLSISGNGSVSIPAFSTGRPFFTLIIPALGGTPGSGVAPKASISGTTLSWTTTSSSSTYLTCLLIYGVY